MATSLSLENDSSLAQGYLKVNGSTAATLTTSGITGNLVGNVTGDVTGNVTGSLTAGGSLTLATAQIASGTAVDFTDIPSWAKRITVMFNGVSTNGTSNIIVQLGASSIETSGYSSSVVAVNVASAGTQFTNGFGITQATAAARSYFGGSIINLISSNSWCQLCNISQGDNTVHSGAGAKTLSGALDRIRITTVNGTDTFDAGTINISYEG
jgi:hypothetical protein